MTGRANCRTAALAGLRSGPKGCSIPDAAAKGCLIPRAVTATHRAFVPPVGIGGAS